MLVNFSVASRLKVNYFCRMVQRHSCVTLHYVARMLTCNGVRVCVWVWVCVVMEHVGASVPIAHLTFIRTALKSCRRPIVFPVLLM